MWRCTRRTRWRQSILRLKTAVVARCISSHNGAVAIFRSSRCLSVCMCLCLCVCMYLCLCVCMYLWYRRMGGRGRPIYQNLLPQCNRRNLQVVQRPSVHSKRACALDQPRSASGPFRGQELAGALGPFCGRDAATTRLRRPQNGPANTLFRACRRPPPPIMVANNGYSPCVNFNSSMFAAANLLQPLQAHRAEVLALTCRMGPPAKQGCAGVDS